VSRERPSARTQLTDESGHALQPPRLRGGSSALAGQEEQAGQAPPAAKPATPLLTLRWTLGAKRECVVMTDSRVLRIIRPTAGWSHCDRYKTPPNAGHYLLGS